MSKEIKIPLNTKVYIMGEEIKVPLTTKICICQSATQEIKKLLNQIEERCVKASEKIGEQTKTPLSHEEITKLGALADILVNFKCELDLVG